MLKHVSALFLVVLLGNVRLAHAADVPLFSPARLSVAATGGYTWYGSAGDTPVPAFGKEFTVGPTVAFNLLEPTDLHPLTPHTSITYAALYGVDNKTWYQRLAISAVIWKGKP